MRTTLKKKDKFSSHMVNIDYNWLYPKLADLAGANSAFQYYLTSSLGSNEKETSVENLEKVIDRVTDLSRLKRRINTLLQEIQINYSAIDILNTTPTFVEGTYELAELIRLKYGEEPMWLFSTYGNLQTFATIYQYSGIADFVLKTLEANFDKLQLPGYFFQFLSQKAYQHNDDPKPCVFFLKWFQSFKHQILDMLVERRRSYFRSREDFNTYFDKICDDEVKFTKDIFIPLLHCLFSEHIYYTHSNDEFGRDVVWSYKNPFEQERFCAAQIKTHNISGAANSDIDGIFSQIDDAFKMPLRIPDGEFFISEFYVITSKNYTRNAVQKILNKIESHVIKNNVKFLDGQRIKELVLRFLRPMKKKSNNESITNQ